ncbi:MAG: hypothetical protein KC470_01090 [Dehalococcoidia bacterium]|nr:hypothetical protein [Dehalococcoidia bacterium]
MSAHRVKPPGQILLSIPDAGAPPSTSELPPGGGNKERTLSIACRLRRRGYVLTGGVLGLTAVTSCVAQEPATEDQRARLPSNGDGRVTAPPPGPTMRRGFLPMKVRERTGIQPFPPREG